MYSLVRKPCLCCGFFFSGILLSHFVKLLCGRRCRMTRTRPCCAPALGAGVRRARRGHWARDEPSIRGLIALPPSVEKKKCAQTGTPLLVLMRRQSAPFRHDHNTILVNREAVPCRGKALF